MENATEGCLSRAKSLVSHVGGTLLMVILLLAALGLASRGVTVSVSKFELSGHPDSELHVAFVVLNDDTEDLAFDIEPVDWINTLEGVTQFVSPGTQTRSCAAWMRLETATARLSPSAETEIAFSISIPSQVSGTYWAGLLVETSHLGADVDGEIKLGRSFLVRVFVTVPPMVADGRVTTVRHGGLSPLDVDVGFVNTGNVRLRNVSGLVTVETSMGDVLLELPIDAFDVLPGEEILDTVTSNWSLYQPGLYAIRAVLDFGGEYLVAGQSVIRIDPLRLVPIGSSLLLPGDLDGDGLYEDVNGDGLLSLDDVDALADAMDSSAIQRNRRAFDFDNDGNASASDVGALRAIVSQAQN